MNDNKEEVLHGGDILTRALHAEGVEYVFGIPGGEFVPFLEALDRWGPGHGMKYVGVRHEQAAGHMADAYARVSGKVAVACATVGPGIVDLIPGIAPAWADNIRMFVFNPAQDKKFEDHHRLQGGIDQIAMLKPIMKYQKHLADPNRVAWAVQKCFKELYSGRPGPVQLEIREDAMRAVVEDYGQVILEPARYRVMDPPAGNQKSIKSAVDVLLGSKKPLILSGGGVASSGSWDILQKLSVDFGIPAMTTIMGVGTISTDRETYIGSSINGNSQSKAAREADVVLALATKFPYTVGYGKSPLWGADAKLIQVDIDPQMIGKNRPVEVGILGDVGVVMQQIYDELISRGATKFADASWLPSLQDARKMDVDMFKKKASKEKIPITPERVIGDLLDFMEPDDILCVDGGDIAVMTQPWVDYMGPRAPRTVLQSIGFGHLGTCIPYCIGAKLAKPDKRVFSITGDGSFLFNVQELDTAIKYDVPFVIVIADNCSWGMIKNAEKRAFKKRDSFYVDICSDYVKIAEGFGCYAEHVEKPADISPALQRAVDSKKPAILQVPIKFVSPPGANIMASLGKLKF
ncbi:MAG: thiamine pyrophosphate-binding protein [Promethearchaeota archaeon]